MNNFFLLKWYRSGCWGKILSVMVGVLFLFLMIFISVFLVPFIENYDPFNKYINVCFGGKVDKSEDYKSDAVENNTIPAIAYWLSPYPQGIGDIYKHISWVEDPDDVVLVACITRVGEEIQDNCVYGGTSSYTIQHYHAAYQVDIFDAHSGQILETSLEGKVYNGDGCPPSISFHQGGSREQKIYAELEKSDVETILYSFMNP